MADYCPTCGEWTPGRLEYAHSCPPRWDVWCPENGEGREDGRLIFALDAEAAAEEWAERDDRDSAGEYDIAHGHDVEVHVAAVGSDVVKRYRVTGEVVPRYDAWGLEDDRDG